MTIFNNQSSKAIVKKLLEVQDQLKKEQAKQKDDVIYVDYAELEKRTSELEARVQSYKRQAERNVNYIDVSQFGAEELRSKLREIKEQADQKAVKKNILAAAEQETKEQRVAGILTRYGKKILEEGEKHYGVRQSAGFVPWGESTWDMEIEIKSPTEAKAPEYPIDYCFRVGANKVKSEQLLSAEEADNLMQDGFKKMTESDCPLCEAGYPRYERKQ